jgi:hypothetical protein
MRAENLNTKKRLKTTQAGVIPVNWTSAGLCDLCEIRASDETSPESKNCVFADKNGRIYAEKPAGRRSLCIQAKRPFSIKWISACLAAESKKNKFTKNALKQIYIPLPPPPEMGNARKTLDFIEKFISQRQRKIGRLQTAEPAEGYKAPFRSSDDKKIRPNGDNQKFEKETEKLLSLRKSLASILEKKL